MTFVADCRCNRVAAATSTLNPRPPGRSRWKGWRAGLAVSAVVAVAGAGTVVGLQTASAATVDTNAFYVLVNRHSGKALDNGAEGDVVTVMNLQSKRTLSGTATGRGQVSITPVSVVPRPPQTSDATSSLRAPQAAPIAVATVSSSVAPKAE